MDPQHPPEPTPPPPGPDAETPDDVAAEDAMATESPAPVPEPGPDEAATQADVPVVAPPAAAAGAVAGPTMPPAGPPPAAPPAAVAPGQAAGPAAWQPTPAAEIGPAPGVRFAPHVGRLIAYIVDGFLIAILVIVAFIVLIPLLVVGSNTQSNAVLGTSVFLYLLVPILISVVYFPFFWARSGQTPGMRIFRLRVVRDADGGKIGGGTAILRWIGLAFIDSIVFGIPLGLIWILVDQRRRAWHDLIAGTCVIEQP